jgi:hypothetical protein
MSVRGKSEIGCLSFSARLPCPTQLVLVKSPMMKNLTMSFIFNSLVYSVPAHEAQRLAYCWRAIKTCALSNEIKINKELQTSMTHSPARLQ